MDIKSENNLMIRQVDISTAEGIYERFLKNDFPRNERKPFRVIRRMMEQNRYQVYASYIKEELAGYAFLAVEQKENRQIGLLDYFAVLSEKRHRGIGTKFLKKLFNELETFQYILIESESITDNCSDEEVRIRRDRFRFYGHCGALHTDVHIELFFVRYDIFAMCREGLPADTETIFTLADFIYRRMYPESWFPRLAKLQK